ncbi:hypothetical protein QCA50_006644 [Cerrena zonata]|uniref:Uncharacterized protein n=1 Tax=Cerrena zonata TaxID=2478898 RepID=A0AAW0GEL4_9APHY
MLPDSAHPLRGSRRRPAPSRVVALVCYKISRGIPYENRRKQALDVSANFADPQDSAGIGVGLFVALQTSTRPVYRSVKLTYANQVRSQLHISQF